jgi:hypothetical protein
MVSRAINVVRGIAVAVVITAPTVPSLAGTWVFNFAKSENVAMMSGADLVSTVTQTPTLLVVRDVSSGNGAHETRYDLSGAAVDNQAPMGDQAKTTSTWAGNRLVTRWESDGAVAGTKVVRTETRYLSPDGKTMFLESRRGTDARIVLAFDRR